MKRCPTCQRVYEDEEMLFCLEDGAALVSFSESAYDASATLKIPAPRSTNETPTEVLPGMMPAEPTQPSPPTPPRHDAPVQAAPSERKPNKMLWILGAALILGLSAIAVALIVTRNKGTNDAQTAQKTDQPESAASPVSVATSTELSDGSAVSQTANPVASPAPTPADSSTSEKQTSKVPPAAMPTLPPKPEATPTPAPAKPSKTIAGGVLTGKAISLPKPAYPPAAKAVRASGTVTVQVTVDESGRVISASAVSGHPLLKQSAESAARSARFSPTTLSGVPVKVTGTVTYNFTLQ